MKSPPLLYGLILAGGASRRMQRDKAALEFQGRQQLHRAFELAEGFCERVFVSVRADQLADPMRSSFPTIVDCQTGLGPIAGIAAAQMSHPEVAWLVLACDLPFLNATTLDFLLTRRDPDRFATAYLSSHDGLPEPLCAIWEPASRMAVEAWIASGKQCPRKLLINSDTNLLVQPDPRALDNVNTPEELGKALAALGEGLQPTPSLKSLRVQYFALFREQAGRSEEMLESNADTPASLYAELQLRHPFRLQKEQLRVAVNAEFCDWQATLKGGDTVVFIPPVAGG